MHYLSENKYKFKGILFSRCWVCSSIERLCVVLCVQARSILKNECKHCMKRGRVQSEILNKKYVCEK